MYLELKHLNKSFEGKPVVRDLSLTLEEGQLMCILGSSGCGKTTTLNMIGGFLPPDSGEILLRGENIVALPPERRPVSTVFQSYGLFPHMTVLANVMYGLKFRGYSRKAAAEKAAHYLKLVQLEEYSGRMIYELSGGQQQRVALARALVVEPQLCLLDEPFCNLDAALRVSMRQGLKKLQKKLGMTMVFVTHDQEEALDLADRIAIMEQGSLIQYGTPMEIFRHPFNSFVRSFLNLDELVWEPDGRLLKVIKK